MIQKTLTSVVAVLFLSSLIVRADDHESGASGSPEIWVTSIAPIGTGGQFVASTARGLLLRPSGVFRFEAGFPNDMTQLYEHPAAVWCVDAAADGTTVASVDYRGNLGVYDIESKKLTVHEKLFERWCQSMVFSPDDKNIVAGNEAGKVMIFDVAAGTVSKTVELEGNSVTGLAFAPGGTKLAASDGGGHVHLFSWPSMEALGKIAISEATAWSVVFSDGGRNLLVGSADRNLYRVEAKADAKAESIAKGTDWITQLAVANDGSVAAGEVGGTLHFPSGGSTDSMDADSGIWALCWNGNSQLLAGTRKHGVVVAGRSWKWAPPAEKKAVEEEASDEPASEQTGASVDQPGGESKEDSASEGAKVEADAKTDAEALDEKGEAAKEQEAKKADQ